MDKTKFRDNQKNKVGRYINLGILDHTKNKPVTNNKVMDKELPGKGSRLIITYIGSGLKEFSISYMKFGYSSKKHPLRSYYKDKVWDHGSKEKYKKG